MRLLLGSLLMLAGAACWIVDVDLPAWEYRQTSAEPQWVRTVDGWELSASCPPPPPQAATVHPLVVAGMQLTVALFGLVLHDQSLTPHGRAGHVPC